MSRFGYLLTEWEALQNLPVGAVVQTSDGTVMRKVRNVGVGNAWRDQDWWEGELGAFPSETLVDYLPLVILKQPSLMAR